MAEKIATFADPITGVDLTLWNIPAMDLRKGAYQRNLSTALRNKLCTSFQVGFFAPIIVIREEGEFFVVDGQHRVSAFIRAKGNFPMLAIEIPPQLKYHVLTFNIEKADQLKDNCIKIHALYHDLYNVSPSMPEADLSQYLEGSPHLATLAFAHCEYELSSPSMVETAIKKFDSWFIGPLADTLNQRRIRAQEVKELVDVVQEAADMAGIKGPTAYSLKSAIISKTNVALWGRSRSISDEFSDAIAMMIDHISSKDWSFLAKG